MVSLRRGSSQPRRPGRRTVRVDRLTKHGNPFKARSEADRDCAIEMHRRWIDGDPEAARMAGRRPPSRHEIRAELRGADLACWCAPKACHADLLLRIANS